MFSLDKIKPHLLPALIVAVFFFFYDMVFHGFLLNDIYEQTAYLWRTNEEMAALLPLTILFYLFFAAAIVALYNCFVLQMQTTKKPVHLSRKFGLIIGLIMALMMASTYIYMPISALLSIAWFFIALVNGLLLGYLLYYIYHKMPRK